MRFINFLLAITLSIILILFFNSRGIYGYTPFTKETFNCPKSGGSANESQICAYKYDELALSQREPSFPIHPLILSRRSLREMSGEGMTDEELFPLFEAMRWGPSNYNNQPWRIVYFHRNTTKFNEFFNLLQPGNKEWAVDAAVLLIVVTDMYSVRNGTIKLLPTQSLSTGLALMNMALESSARGYALHIMGGFDRETETEVLGIGNNTHFKIEVMVAIGKRPPLSERGKKKVSDKMTQRKPISEFISRDRFKTEWIY